MSKPDLPTALSLARSLESALRELSREPNDAAVTARLFEVLGAVVRAHADLETLRVKVAMRVKEER